MRTRAERRHHEWRMKQKVAKFRWLRDKLDYWPKDTNRIIGIVSKTKHPCSCYSCGNPRKHFNQKTLQEMRFEEGLNDE